MSVRVYHSEMPKQKSEVHINRLLLQLIFWKHCWNGNRRKPEILKAFIPNTDNLKQNTLINSSKGILFNNVQLEISLALGYAKFRTNRNYSVLLCGTQSSSEEASMKIQSLQYQSTTE